MPHLPLLAIHTDGASRGNPGAAAFAYVIRRDGEETVEEAGRCGRMTNNQAEYTALVRALEHALELGAQYRVLVHSDSELMVKQMNGEYRVKNGDLRGLYEQALALADRFQGGVGFLHVRREDNRRADELGNEALDGLREPTPRASMFQKSGPLTPRAASTPPKPLAPRAAHSPPPLREQAVTCLRRAAAAWASGAAEPTPEQVWEQLLALLEQHGLPSPPGGR